LGAATISHEAAAEAAAVTLGHVVAAVAAAATLVPTQFCACQFRSLCLLLKSFSES